MQINLSCKKQKKKGVFYAVLQEDNGMPDRDE